MVPWIIGGHSREFPLSIIRNHTLFLFSEFSDCVGLFAKDAKNKAISSPEELTIIMRSLGFSPTIKEIEIYYQQNQNGEN